MMKHRSSARGARAAVILAVALAVGLGWSVAALAATATAKAQKHFATPEEALQALVAAAKSNDTSALQDVLGPGSKRIVESGDSVADNEARARFVRSYDEQHSIVQAGDTTAFVQIGKDEWSFPIPLVKDANGWRFDTAAGEREILDRRIGRNELSAIQASLAYVDAQREYYSRNPEKSSLLHYADRLFSTKGKRDGLYFETAEGEPPSPLGESYGRAKAEAYGKGEPGKPAPYHGYYFRILKAQGPHAKGGAYDYVAKGQMIGGFALVAYPATWGTSGVMTFLVNQDGVVFQKDLGPKTSSIATSMKTFDPDESWAAVPDQDQEPPPAK